MVMDYTIPKNRRHQLQNWIQHYEEWQENTVSGTMVITNDPFQVSDPTGEAAANLMTVDTVLSILGIKSSDDKEAFITRVISGRSSDHRVGKFYYYLDKLLIDA